MRCSDPSSELGRTGSPERVTHHTSVLASWRLRTYLWQAWKAASGLPHWVLQWTRPDAFPVFKDLWSPPSLVFGVWGGNVRQPYGSIVIIVKMTFSPCWKSQQALCAVGAALSATPSNLATRIGSALFRVLLLRRLRLPLPPVSRSSDVAVFLTPAGVLGQRFGLVGA